MSTTTDCQEFDGYDVAGFSIGWFVLGMVLATAILIYITRCHRWIWEVVHCKLCKRQMKKSMKDRGTVKTNDKSHFFTDIYEMANEQTTQESQVGHKLQVGHKKQMSVMPKNGYDHCIGKQRRIHRYSSIAMKNRVDYKSQEYEDVEINTDSESEEEIYAPNHIYSILDPGSNKRLPVKALPKEGVKPDPGHVYFVLTPGTNQVKPLFSVDSTLRRMEDRIYFVLEPSLEQVDDSNAYAVSDLGPEYYILEPM